MRRLTKIFRDRNPQGRGLVWCLRWSDRVEEYTNDSASGRDRFRLVDELRLRQADLDERLTAKYHRLETQKGFIR